MPITPLDLKLRKSERMTDFDDGGGRMAADEVVDGVMNNVFPDLSDADGIRGAVHLRKVFLHVDTANTDTYLDPFAFLTDLPANENVSVLLFDTKSPTDERADARNYYENYRTRGVKSQFVLYGTHFVGQQTLQVYCRSEIASPDIGDVLCLSIEETGYTPHEQFVKVEEVLSRITTTFTDGGGDFQRDVLIIKLTTALQYEFPGIEDPVRYTTTPITVVRQTQVADAARYYGFAACEEAPQTGDTIIKIASPYIPAVPATQAETALTDQLAGLGSRAYVPAGTAGSLTMAFSGSASAGAAETRYFGTPYVPGSLNLTIGAVALRDDGSGGIVAVNESDTGWSGDADYQTGAFSIARDVGWSGSVTAAATPAGVVVEQSYTFARGITATNRNLTHVFQLPGKPSPGTVVVDYLVLGKWVRLRDTGRGQLAGNPGEGGGTINYATGSIAITLGGLPDVDSAIVVAWGVDVRARNSSGEISIPTPVFRQQLAHGGIEPASLVMTWTSGGSAKTASADAAGAITGDATGSIDVTSGIVEFTTAALPDTGEQFHYAYDWTADLHTETFTPTPSSGHVSITLANAPAANSVVARWTITAANPNGGQGFARGYTVTDNGSGGFNGALSGTNTINYATGEITLRVQ